MVNPDAINTFANFDVCPETGAERLYDRRLQGTGRLDPMRPAHRGPGSKARVRAWTVPVFLASRADIAGLRRIWDLTSKGTMPLLATPPWGGDPIPATIQNGDLEYVLRAGTIGRYEITLQEWIG